MSNVILELLPWVIGLSILHLFRFVYELYPKKKDVKGVSDCFHEEYKLNMEYLKHGYRIVYKWWVFHVYKKYDDLREHHLGEFVSSKQTRDFIISDMKGTESD